MNGTTEENITLSHYGKIGFDNDNYYLLNNESIYIYPEILSSDKLNILLKLEIPYIAGGYLTVNNPRVSWGGNLNLGTTKAEVENRINMLLDKASTDVQFHWINEPSGDLALVDDNLGDPYSLFDRNNVANIITIPVIDLENSYIDIIRSMRNY